MKGLLKFITCGSVDDGKSTLIGHILYDSKLLYADQEQALKLDSKVGSREGDIDYSLLLDGLMAEREQGITIDVAYRYFTTDHRSFIVADTPGHEEYTRNMAVGASFADLSILLVDATKGVLSQTKRHVRICSLMGIRQFVFAINKMDLVNYEEHIFLEIVDQIQQLLANITVEGVLFIPISATEGDNLTKRSPHTPWYEGEDLLTYLESIEVSETTEDAFYMPVQRVCRPNYSFRGFQGQIESGTIAVGDTITALPSGESAVVSNLYHTDTEVEEASAGEPVTIRLDREVDVSRGCILCKEDSVRVSDQFTGTILWMDTDPLQVGANYFVKLGTSLIPGIVTEIVHKIDIEDGRHTKTSTLGKNEIAQCKIQLDHAIGMEVFAKHKSIGEFILIDRISHMTSACGVIEEVSSKTIEDATFYIGERRVASELFYEWYLNDQNDTIVKQRDLVGPYTVGDCIPTDGETYHYPDSFDVLLEKDALFVCIRNQKIFGFQTLEEYEYSNHPVVNDKGLELCVHSTEEMRAYLSSKREDTYRKYVRVSTYRSLLIL